MVSSKNNTSYKKKAITKKGISIPLLDLTGSSDRANQISMFAGPCSGKIETFNSRVNSRRNSRRQTPRGGNSSLNVKYDDVNNSFDDAFDPIDQSARASRKDKKAFMEKVKMEEE